MNAGCREEPLSGLDKTKNFVPASFLFDYYLAESWARKPLLGRQSLLVAAIRYQSQTSISLQISLDSLIIKATLKELFQPVHSNYN